MCSICQPWLRIPPWSNTYWSKGCLFTTGNDCSNVLLAISCLLVSKCLKTFSAYGNFFACDDQKTSRNDSLDHEEVDICLKSNYFGYFCQLKLWKQSCTHLITPFYKISLGVTGVDYLSSVSPRNYFLTGRNFPTTNQRLLFCF